MAEAKDYDASQIQVLEGLSRFENDRVCTSVQLDMMAFIT